MTSEQFYEGLNAYAKQESTASLMARLVHAKLTSKGKEALNLWNKGLLDELDEFLGEPKIPELEAFIKSTYTGLRLNRLTKAILELTEEEEV